MRPALGEQSASNMTVNSLLQRRDHLFDSLLPRAHSLNSDLGDLLKLTHLPNSRVGRVSRTKLPRPRRLPTTFRVSPGPRVAARTGLEDGGFTGGHGRGGRVKDEAETTKRWG